MPGSGPACLACRTWSDPVVPRCPNLLTHFPDFSGSRPDPPGHDPARHFGSHFGSPQTPIDVRHPDTSKPPTAFPLVGGLSSVSTQSAPEGIRTPNLLIRSNSIGPTRAESARPQTKPGGMFVQVTGVRTRQGGAGRGVTDLRSAEFWVTFWVRWRGRSPAFGPRCAIPFRSPRTSRASGLIAALLTSSSLRPRRGVG